MIGRYWIDHINKRNVVDDPRTGVGEQKLDAVRAALDQGKHDIQMQEGQLQKKLLELQQSQQKVKEMRTNEPQHRIAEEEAKVKKLSEETEQAQAQVSTLKADLGEVTQIVNRLDVDNNDQLVRQQQVQKEIEALRQTLDKEIQAKQKLQIELEDLHSLMVRDAAPADNAAQEAVKQVGLAIEASRSSAPKAGTEAKSLDKMTRIERELELLALKKKLESQKEQTAKLLEIRNLAKAEIMAALQQTQKDNVVGGKHLKAEWIQKVRDSIIDGEVGSFTDGIDEYICKRRGDHSHQDQKQSTDRGRADVV